METNVVKEKSVQFALRIIKLSKYLKAKKREFVISKQILRSGTSIGANITEAQCGQSKKDFYAKMYIAYKEATETSYWLYLLYRSGYINSVEYDSMIKDNIELIKLLTAITKSQKLQLSNKTSNQQPQKNY